MIELCQMARTIGRNHLSNPRSRSGNTELVQLMRFRLNRIKHIFMLFNVLLELCIDAPIENGTIRSGVQQFESCIKKAKNS